MQCEHRREADEYPIIRDLGARREWVGSATLQPLYPQEKESTHCIGSCAGLRAGLDGSEKSPSVLSVTTS
jgi:hypothetical protein